MRVTGFAATTGDQIARLSADGDPVSSIAVCENRVLFEDTGGKAFVRPLYLEPWEAIAEAEEILNAMSPLSNADRCRFFLLPVDMC